MTVSANTKQIKLENSDLEEFKREPLYRKNNKVYFKTLSDTQTYNRVLFKSNNLPLFKWLNILMLLSLQLIKSNKLIFYISWNIADALFETLIGECLKL